MSKLSYNIDDILGSSDIPEAIDLPGMTETPSFPEIGGQFESGQYVGGQADFQDVNIGQHNITVDTTQGLQKAINALTETGGIVNLKAGNYTITSNIAVSSAIRIKGENTSTTILTFVGATGFTLTGTNIYTTGTVSINQGSTALTGSGTTWTSAMVGRQVFISNRWYVISAFVSATSLTLATAFSDANVSGASYRIVSVIKDVEFEEFTIQASSGTGISGTDVRDLYFEDIEILACNKGFTFTNFMAVQMTRVTIAASISNGCELTNGSFFNPIQVASVSNGGVGTLLNNIKSCPWLFCANNSNTGDGFDLTNVDQCLFSAECSGNGGYGIDISNSGCDNNIITSSIFSGNVSGTVNDSGTSTIIKGNIGINDNSTSGGGNSPIGAILSYIGRTAPSGFLLCDGTAVSRTTYANLLAVIAPSGTFTVTIASPAVFTKTGHGLVVGDKISLTTTGALPTGLATNTDYFVISAGLTADAFEVSTSRGGAAVNTSGTQSGVHTLYATNYGKGDGSTTFNLPDLRGYTPYGYKSSDANFDVLNAPNTYVGEKTHVLTVAELAAHTHSINVGSVVGGDVYIKTDPDGIETTKESNSTGGNTAHNTMPPYLVVNWIIKF